MKQRFVQLANKLDLNIDATKEFDLLASLYQEPQRNYHTLQHIDTCLNEFDEIVEVFDKPNLAELSLWYHDAIYDTQAKDNEEQSAKLAYTVCRSGGLSKEASTQVKQFVLATSHSHIPTMQDEKYIMDIDLAILGKNTTTFWKYEKQIRNEYSWVDQKQFAQARAEILETFLDRESIYATQLFQEKYEARARKNLRKAITALQ